MLAIQRFTAIGAIDAAFNLYRAHFQVLFVISALVNAPPLVVGLMLGVVQHRVSSELGIDPDLVFSTFTEPGPWVLLLGLLFIVSLVVGMLCNMVGIAATTEIASRLAVDATADVWAGLEAARRFFWPLLGVSLVTTLAISLGLLLCIVPGLVLMAAFAFVSPAVVVEGASVTSAIERSWFLSAGRRLKIFGVMALLFTILWTAMAGLTVVIQLLPGIGGTLAASVAQTLMTSAISALVLPVPYVVLVLLYYDARVEHEAFDVQVLARSTGVAATHEPQL